MVTKYVLPILAVAGVVFAIYTVVEARQAAAGVAADRRAADAARPRSR